MIIVLSRSGIRYLLAAILCGVAGALCAPFSLKIEMAQSNPVVVVGLAELAALALACTGLIVMRPRLWSVDRLGVTRRRWIPTACVTVLSLVCPQLVLAGADVVALPAGTWPPSATTVLFLTGLGLLLAPYTGALRATGVVLTLYVGLVLASQISHDVRLWSPLVAVTWPTVSGAPLGKVVLAWIVAAAALVVQIRTLGSTMRTWRSELNAS
ncbi:hypothetical protein [Actinoplanes palleronii]|uniref:hypothetical protein n=1 Tax=Actinoplanes palleronii TaxID=113570 RepID=UPI001940EB38|nr:hypothetical protein [Actinoplanes palleronii]